MIRLARFALLVAVVSYPAFRTLHAALRFGVPPKPGFAQWTTPDDHRLAPGDVVLFEAALSVSLGYYRCTVGPDGCICIPRVGRLPVSGLNSDQALAVVRKSLLPYEHHLDAKIMIATSEDVADGFKALCTSRENYRLRLHDEICVTMSVHNRLKIARANVSHNTRGCPPCLWVHGRPVPVGGLTVDELQKQLRWQFPDEVILVEVVCPGPVLMAQPGFLDWVHRSYSRTPDLDREAAEDLATLRGR